MIPQPGDIWRRRSRVSYGGSKPEVTTILLLKEVGVVTLNGVNAIEFSGYCFETGEKRPWFLTKDMNRWRKVA